MLPIDVALDMTTQSVLKDVPTAVEFAEELKMNLHEIYQHVNRNLDRSRQKCSDTTITILRSIYIMSVTRY